MSMFEKFEVDEISIDEAEDDICFNAKDCFEDSYVLSQIGLRLMEDKNSNKWKIKKSGILSSLSCPI